MKRDEQKLAARPMLILLLALTAILLPHALRSPLWMSTALAGLIGWRALAAWKQYRMPGRWLTWPLAFALMAGVLLSYKTLLGREGGVALLITLVGAKLLETRSPRDARLLIVIGYFLLLTSFMFSQSPLMAVYLLGLTGLITALLIGWQRVDTPFRLSEDLRRAAMMLGQALPLMLVLFLLFPRIEGPLWRLPQAPAGSRSGLADSMSPGSFSNMSQDDSVAFRVRFTSPPPDEGQLYWRGPVFDQFDGTTWRQSPVAPQAPDLHFTGKPRFQYQITLEPHQRLWLLSLDFPSALPPDSLVSAAGQLMSKSPVEKRLRLELESDPGARLDSRLPAEDLTPYLALPEQGNPLARALAREWSSLPPVQRIARAQRHFERGGYQYSLTPPLYPVDSVDGLLFKGKEGFCEHYAGAFVFLMRASGLPARVVGGYLGGEQNEDYLIIRQADAHAWAEVWQAEIGWVRVDPTAWVAPGRISDGLSAAVGDADALPLMVQKEAGWIRAFRLKLDSAINGWNQWVIGYTPQQQAKLLQKLGIQSLLSQTFVFLFGGLLLAMLIPVVWWLLRQTRTPPRDAMLVALDKLCIKAGLPRQPAESVADYLARLETLDPSKSHAHKALLLEWRDIRYGQGDNAAGKRWIAKARSLGSS